MPPSAMPRQGSARSLGVPYLPADEIALLPLHQIIDRLELLPACGAYRDSISQDAALGLAKAAKPKILLSTLLQTHEDAARADISDYSPNQMRRWRNAKARAVNNLIARIGDRELSGLTRANALEYRTWWQERIIEEKVDPDSI